MLRVRQASGVVLGLLLGSYGMPLTAESSCIEAGLPETAQLVAGLQETRKFETPIKRVAVGNPDIADVELLDEQQLLLTAKQAGITNLQVWTGGCPDSPHEVTLTIRGPAAAAAQGGVALDREAQLQPQVQTDIKVVEVSRQKLREVGSSLFFREGAFNFGTGAAGNFSGAIGNLMTGNVIGSGFNILFGGGSRDFLAALSALENSGFAYTLAEPSLVALSGQSANFLAGGEFPVPVRGGFDNSVTIEYKEFGVRLALTPTVLDNDHIMLKVAPEVSELDFSTGIESGGVTVPSLRVRRTETSVQLADGESFVISGLISTNNRSEVERLPGLGEIPVLGAFFRSSQLQSDNRELLMIVTPRLVKPLRADARTPALPGEDFRHYQPGFLEFYLHEDGSYGRRDGFGFSD